MTRGRHVFSEVGEHVNQSLSQSPGRRSTRGRATDRSRLGHDEPALVYLRRNANYQAAHACGKRCGALRDRVEQRRKEVLAARRAQRPVQCDVHRLIRDDVVGRADVLSNA